MSIQRLVCKRGRWKGNELYIQVSGWYNVDEPQNKNVYLLLCDSFIEVLGDTKGINTGSRKIHGRLGMLGWLRVGGSDYKGVVDVVLILILIMVLQVYGREKCSSCQIEINESFQLHLQKLQWSRRQGRTQYAVLPWIQGERGQAATSKQSNGCTSVFLPKWPGSLCILVDRSGWLPERTRFADECSWKGLVRYLRNSWACGCIMGRPLSGDWFWVP